MNDHNHLRALQRYGKQHRGFPAMAKLCEVAGMSSTASVLGLAGGAVRKTPTKRNQAMNIGQLRRLLRPLPATMSVLLRDIEGGLSAEGLAWLEQRLRLCLEAMAAHQRSSVVR